MFAAQRRRNRASGLIIALGVLAMLAIMATTFVTLMRLNTQLARVYTDDLQVEMLASGVANYCVGVLRDDQDRTMFKYENRDQAVGGRDSWQGMGSYSSGDPKAVTDFRMSLPGRDTGWWAANSAHVMATGPSNDVWYHSASDGYMVVGFYADTGHWEATQSSFGGAGYDLVLVNDCDVVVSNARTPFSPGGGANRYYYSCVTGNYNGIDDDGDGQTDPNYTYNGTTSAWEWPDSAGRETSFMSNYLYDSTGFLTHGLTCYLNPGTKLAGAWDGAGVNNMSGMMRLPGNLFWRWAAKIGIQQERYISLNAFGNMERAASNAGRFADLDGRGLVALNRDTTNRPSNQGILSWRGYPGEVAYNAGGFHQLYDAVQFSPYQIDPYRVLANTSYYSATNIQSNPILPAARSQTMADGWVQKRWGDDGLPGDGADNLRIGWRRDGASYYKLPSPDNPQGNDYYFGAGEALNHLSEDIVPTASRVYQTVLEANGGNMSLARQDFGLMRSYVSTYGCDTILRGKLWPNEGPPYTDRAGNWRHMDILRKINLNMLGARAADTLSGNSTKASWASRAARERDRLYYMVRAMLEFTNTPNPSREACQVVASLTDMVDWDQDETYYVAPDNSAWALGVEKHPVINEIACAIGSAANTPNYTLYRFRMELYNPAENIPWVPDADEAYEIKDYVIRLGSVDFSVGDLSRFSAIGITDDMGAGAQIKNIASDSVRKIGADGLYGLPIPGWVSTSPADPTWSRYYHLGWKNAGVSDGNWPTGLTKTMLEGPSQSGMAISLWKPLRGDAANTPLSGGKVEDIGGRRYVCVDTTGIIRLVQPYGGSTGRNGPAGNTQTTFLSSYRRWDPMNARIYLYQGNASNYGTHDSCNVVWCPGWLMAGYNTLGRPNMEYKANAYTTPNNATVDVTNKYQRQFETNFKVPDSDLPSVGWLGEMFLKNCAQDGPLTLVSTEAQPSNLTSGVRSARFKNLLELAKLDLFRPWDKVHNLHFYDMFTVWDPMHDGIDNDGDGTVDEEDTGYQAGDLLGPEVRVYGVLDINHINGQTFLSLWPGSLHPRIEDTFSIGQNLERSQGNHVSWDWHCEGPRDSIGDLLRFDDIRAKPGNYFGNFYAWSPAYSGYKSSYNLTGGSSSDTWGQGFQMVSWVVSDDDGDGIYDERDERDFWFTQMSNFITTRSHTFAVEIVTQITDPPRYPGRNTARGSYKVNRVYSQKNLLLLVDRSTTLRFRKAGNYPGPCDFTGPVRVLARRWSHVRQ